MEIIQQTPQIVTAPGLNVTPTSVPTLTSPILSTPSNSTSQLPFFTLNGSLPQASKPMGSKICRWVQNDGTVCGKAFSKLDSLRRHVNELHKGVRPFGCHICETSYGRRDYLDRHLLTHEKKNKQESLDLNDVLMAGDEEPPPPKVPKKKRKDIPAEEKKICLWILEDSTACGKTFTKFDSLKRHVTEAHRGVRPYSCTLCGKTYGRRDYLLRHLKSHNDIEVSNLNIAKVTNNPSTGVSNQTVSAPTPEQLGASASAINFNALVPASQPQLGGGGSTGAPLKLAQTAKKRASDDKKTCKWVLENGTVCGRTFSKFDSLRRHVAELHKGMRPFVCELCDKNYGRKDYLDRHIKTTHQKEGENGDLVTTDSGSAPPAGGGGMMDHLEIGHVVDNVVDDVMGGEMPTGELDDALDGATTIVTVDNDGHIGGHEVGVVIEDDDMTGPGGLSVIKGETEESDVPSSVVTVVTTN